MESIVNYSSEEDQETDYGGKRRDASLPSSHRRSEKSNPNRRQHNPIVESVGSTRGGSDNYEAVGMELSEDTNSSSSNNDHRHHHRSSKAQSSSTAKSDHQENTKYSKGKKSRSSPAARPTVKEDRNQNRYKKSDCSSNSQRDEKDTSYSSVNRRNNRDKVTDKVRNKEFYSRNEREKPKIQPRYDLSKYRYVRTERRDSEKDRTLSAGTDSDRKRSDAHDDDRGGKADRSTDEHRRPALPPPTSQTSRRSDNRRWDREEYNSRDKNRHKDNINERDTYRRPPSSASSSRHESKSSQNRESPHQHRAERRKRSESPRRYDQQSSSKKRSRSRSRERQNIPPSYTSDTKSLVNQQQQQNRDKANNDQTTSAASTMAALSQTLSIAPPRSDTKQISSLLAIDTSKTEPSSGLPAYYNPNAINVNKYTEQIQKRKLLWGNKKVEESASKWGNAKFTQDNDGKVASKFMRLMGMKGAAAATGPVVVPEPDDSASSQIDSIKKKEEMFSKMEHQYEVARQVTHSMRGVGLGFGSQPRQF